MKKIKAILLIVLLLFVSFACNDKEEDSTVIGDVIVVSKKLNNQVVYGYAYYAYAYSSLKSVEVTGVLHPEKVQLILSDELTDNYFYKEPEDDDFSTVKPILDTFTFNAVFKSGNTYVDQDIVSSDILDPVTIEKCEYNSSAAQGEFVWTALSNADGYAISLYDDETLIFSSSVLLTTNTKATLSSTAVGWKSGYPVSGKTYKVRFYAYKYESSTDPNSYHVQSTSYNDTSIVWGE